MLRRLPVLVLITLAACAPPPDELYDRGQRAEMEGRYEEAVDYYIRALEGEPGMRKAQGRLHVAGGILLGQYLATAAVSAPPEAADAYLAAEDLMRRTAAVGVVLDQAPTTFDEDLAAALDAAVEFLLAEGADALAAGRFDAALAAFERAARYRPSAEQAAALRAFTFDAHLAWAEAELAAGRYRAAYDRAEAARPFAGGDRRPEEVDALQAEAVEIGSVSAAVFPLEVEGGLAVRPLPRGFLDELDDLLGDEHWTRPPLFVRTADPVEVRRLLRSHYDPDDRLDSPRLTAALARDLDADLGVAATLARYDRDVEETDRDTLTAELRGGGRGRYVRVVERVTLRAAVPYAVVDARSAVVACEGEATAEADGEVRRGEQIGRGSLVLPREDQDLFDEEAQAEAEREIERDLQGRLAERLAGRVFDCLLREVP
jgi:tetratricopeptide (TPR) repeat protein